MGYEREDRRPGGGYGGNGGGGRREYRSEQERSRGYSYGADRRSQGRNDYEDYRGNRFDDRSRDRDARSHDDDRGFFERAGDEVRSWFGDEDAERRRREDERNYERNDRYAGGRPTFEGYGSQQRGYGAGQYGSDRAQTDRGYSSFGGRGREASGDYGRDPGYHSWRDRQIQQFDTDYDEYRREHQQKFDNEFHSWRQGRQGQRDLLGKVQEHQEVVGSDGQHVGKVDHVRGDRIKLTKNDQDAKGHHHSIPSSWLQSVDDKVTISKTADQAKQHWRDEERNSSGFFGDDGKDRASSYNRSFSGY